ncbi:hypothetical protein TRIUR3_19724 [Triticum urartu]|uniref:Uncharacterized protein n=1 Tax=Triticum urartu TaxID=4572 RepID=M7ZJE4_TRIUA|nr:hypothetical protein TRIUR3_19724 [Triticum urartu]
MSLVCQAPFPRITPSTQVGEDAKTSETDFMAPSTNTNANDYNRIVRLCAARQVRRRSPPERLPPTRTSPSLWVSSSSMVNPEVLGSVKSNNDCVLLSATLNDYETRPSSTSPPKHVPRPSLKTPWMSSSMS